MAIKTVRYLRLGFERIIDFQGRSNRSEFWWFGIVVWFISLVFDAVEALFTGRAMMDGEFFVLSAIWTFLVIIPHLSLSARRLHDINKSGWWQLLSLTIIGIPVLIYWYVKKSDDGHNDYGAPSHH